jgi:hypothetical protein
MPNDFFDETRQTRLAFWGLGQMLKGAAYAGAFVVGIGVIVWAIYLLGLLLPEESRQTPDPMAAYEAPLVADAQA